MYLTKEQVIKYATEVMHLQKSELAECDIKQTDIIRAQNFVNARISSCGGCCHGPSYALTDNTKISNTIIDSVTFYVLLNAVYKPDEAVTIIEDEVTRHMNDLGVYAY